MHLLLLVLLALASAACAPGEPSREAVGATRQAVFTVPQQTLTPSVPTDDLGAVRLTADRIAVLGFGARAAYVFVRTGSTWTEEDRIDIGSAGWANALAFDGTTLVVGNTQDDTTASNAGAAYVYERSGSTWTQSQVLVASDAAADDQIGTTVAVRGDDLFVGSFWSGLVYHFVRQAGTWAEQQKFSGGTDFGWGLELEGDTLLISQRGSGAFYYDRSSSPWVERQHILHPANPGSFGWSLDLDGDRAAISWRDGATAIYDRTGSTWTEVAMVSPSTPQQTMGGFPSLGLQSDVLTIGSAIDDDPIEDAGAVFTFSERSGTWSEAERIDSPEPTFQGRFGGLDLVGNTLAVSGNKKLYVYDVEPKGDLAAPCDEDRQCLSGSCADGVCCDAACTETCRACVQSATGVADGTCAPVSDGADPRDDCTDPAPGSCGPDGFCDGSGACRTVAPAGTGCGPATCENRQRTTLACDGAGACEPTTESCGDYTCDGDACHTSCGTDDDCAPDFTCEGDVCTSSAECTDDLTAVLMGDGTREECAPYTCLTGTCLTRCAASAECAAGFVCDTSSAECIDTTAGSGTKKSDDDGGCGCRMPGSGGHAGGRLAAMAIFGLLALARARRNRRAFGVTAAVLVLGCSPAELEPPATSTRSDAVSYVSSTPDAIVGDQTEPSVNPFLNRVIINGDVMVAALGTHVEVRRRQGSDWMLVQTLSSPIASFSQFGECLDFDGTTIVVGEPAQMGAQAEGALYVYSPAGMQWQETAVIENQAGLNNLGRGHCAVRGDTIVAAANGTSGNRSVGVFERSGSVWSSTQTIDITSEQDWFGNGVALDADRLVVLQQESGTSRGLAHFYRHDGSSWVPDGTVSPPAGCGMGRAVTLKGDRAAMATFDCSETMVANRAGGTWALASGAGWVAPSPAQPTGTPTGMHFYQDMLIVGYGFVDIVDLFTEDGNGWRLHQRLTETLGSNDFGTSVSADAGWLAVLAPTDTPAPVKPEAHLYALVDTGPDGQACADTIECSSGLCVEAVCCDAECGDPCMSCLAALTGAADGTCAPITAGTDPDDDCGLCAACDGAGACTPATDGTDPLDDCDPDTSNACGADGECNGSGACRVAAPEGTSCGDASCEDAQASVPQCDGLGSCVAAPMACEPYACDGTACGTSCSDAAGCADGFFCNDGTCEAGGTCSADSLSVITSAGETPCAPYLCNEGACSRMCSGSSECAPGSVCEKNACVRPDDSAADDGGCGCRTPAAPTAPRGGFLALALLLLATRRRRRYRGT